MTPELYRRVVEIFEQAYDRSLEYRGEFLSQVCNGENDLRVEIEAMLTADEQAGRFFNTPPGDIAAAVVVSKQARSLIGQDFGDYQVIAHLGSGGIGEVFLAQDTRLGRRAALKFLCAFASICSIQPNQWTLLPPQIIWGQA
jgi:eukaryotic-like serine/threonine-protein kinase